MSDASATLPMAATAVRLSRIVDALDTNLYGDVHGGAIMRFIDEAAGVAACRFMGGQMSTVAVDGMQFVSPVHTGDVISCDAQVNWTGHTSCEVGVRVTAQSWEQRADTARHVATAYMIFVAVGSDQRPRAVPGVVPESCEDKRRMREAEIRRQSRQERRRAIEQSRADQGSG
jgi:acyl-CoA hydrolase